MAISEEEKRERKKMRRDKRAGLFFDLCKLTFAGMVIGGITPMFTKSYDEITWPLIVGGALATIIFAYIGDYILK